MLTSAPPRSPSPAPLAAFRAVGAAVVLAALSALLVRPAPSYDPWAWMLWGRQVLAGGLDTLEGPAFKPLPVAVGVVLAALGPAAPWLWVVLARAGGLLAVGLAFRLGHRLAGGSLLSGVLAAAAVALCGRYLAYASSGVAEGLLLALALGAAEAWRGGRPRWSLALAVGCGLLRVETWPFLAVAALPAWRRRPQDRALIAAAAVLVPAAWVVAEVVGSGDPLRSAARAQVIDAGHPALATRPALASLAAAAALPLWPVWAGVVLLAAGATRRSGAARAALVPAVAGGAWIAVVAAMAEAGFSGEPRYALPGAALVSVSGAAGLATAVRALARWQGAAAVAVSLAFVVAAAPPVAELGRVREEQAHQWALQSDLARAVTAAGGAEAVLACGTPYVGPLRGPVAAYRLGVPKRVVEPDRAPAAPGVVFRSPLTVGAVPTPAVPPEFERVATTGTWDVFASCAGAPGP